MLVASSDEPKKQTSGAHEQFDMRAAARPRLRAAGDAKGGPRRGQSRILLVLALALTGWVVAFARLRRSTLPGVRDFGRRSGHTPDDDDPPDARPATFDAASLDSANARREHDDHPDDDDPPDARPATFDAASLDSANARREHDEAVTSAHVPPHAPASPAAPPAEPRDAVTFVLVSTMSPDSAPRIANLLASMRAFLEPRVVAELLVLVPDAELDWWSLAASALGADAPWGATRVVPESQALPTPVHRLRASAPGAARREARGLGYRTQMLLKLAAGSLVRTPFYVTLDCDVVLRQALRTDDLLDTSRRRALAQGAMRGPHAKRWLSDSLDALFGETPGAAAEAAIDVAVQTHATNDKNERLYTSAFKTLASRVASCGAETTSRGVGVTPAILSAATARRAIAFLDETYLDQTSDASSDERKENTRWDARLFRSLDSGLDWTEYGVYAAFLCVEGTFHETHFVDPTRELYDAKLQEDGSKFANPNAMRAAFGRDGDGDGGRKNKGSGAVKTEKQTLFVVVQSIGGSDPVGAARAVKPFILGNT